MVKKDITISKITAAILSFILLVAAVVIICKFDFNIETSTAASDSSQHYPGREIGDYTDTVFRFDKYLANAGTKNVRHYLFIRNGLQMQQLEFDQNGAHFKLTTTILPILNDEFAEDSGPLAEVTTYISNTFTIEQDGITYAIPATGSGNFVMDQTSPLWIDRNIFDLFHCLTNRDMVQMVHSSWLEESNCPFRGSGFAHYEQWEDGTIVWHDDAGPERFDLHY